MLLLGTLPAHARAPPSVSPQLRPSIPATPEQTPPPSANCGAYTAHLAVESPNPASGPAGTHLTIVGSGFYPSGPAGYVQLWLATASGTYLLTLTTVASGTPEPFTVKVDLPGVGADGGLTLGSYFLWGLNDTDPSNCADAQFNLTGVNPGLACEAWSSELNVTSPTPAVGVVGTPVGLQGTDFYDDNTTYVYWAAADGSSLTYLESVTSSGSGGFELTVDVPSGFDPGLYFFWATDGTSDYLCSGAMFNLTSGPTLVLTPDEGAYGSSITVTGSGFSASDSSVLISSSVIQSSYPCTLTDGSISGACTFTVTGGLAGPQNVTGVGNVVGGDLDTGTAAFTVEPSILLNPTSGARNTTMGVYGYDFSAYPAAADLSFDGVLLTDTGGSDCAAGSADTLITLDSGGGFDCNFTVPSSATLGANTVQADDTSTGEVTAPETFTVVPGPTLLLTPNSAAVGATVTVTASGFSTSDTSIELSGAVIQFPYDCTLVDGSISGSCTFQVFTGYAGPQTVTGVGNVVGGAADSATATLTLEPTLTLSVDSGPRGLVVMAGGEDFSASPADVNLLFDGEPIAPWVGSDCPTDPLTYGEVSCYFAVPQSAPVGANTVQAQDSQTGELTNVLTFTVTLPFVSEVSSTSGAAGPVTFSVEGLGPSIPYLVYLDSSEGVESSASYNPIGSCTSTADGTLSDCEATIPAGLSPGTYYLDLYQDPTPPPFIFSVFHFPVGPSKSPRGWLNPFGLSGPENELLGGGVAALIAIAIALVLVQRRRRRRSQVETGASPPNAK